MMKTEVVEGITFFSLEERQIDTLNAEEVRLALTAACKNTSRVVLDLNEVQFIDSSGLGVLLALVREMHEKGGAITICCARPPVKALFRMVRLSNIVTINDTREDAVHSFTS